MRQKPRRNRLAAKRRLHRAAHPLVLGIIAPATVILPANANLIIDPTFDVSITSDPNAAAIENAINTTIGIYETDFTDPITALACDRIRSMMLRISSLLCWMCCAIKAAA